MMEELIKEAERLYKLIDKIQVNLISSRLVGNEEKKQAAINHMETLMCSTLQFLAYIIQHKSNIINLVFHSNNEIPDKSKPIIAISIHNCCISGYYRETCLTHVNFIQPCGIYTFGIYMLPASDILKWIYVEDLLPKGGE